MFTTTIRSSGLLELEGFGIDMYLRKLIAVSPLTCRLSYTKKPIKITGNAYWDF